MADNFSAGEADADTGAPPIETMGARMHISVAMRGRGEPVQPVSAYTMPPVQWVNGNMETVVPAIQLTDLGAEMPHPAMPAPQLDMQDYRMPVPDQAGPFVTGIGDSYPEGCPVPFGVGRGQM